MKEISRLIIVVLFIFFLLKCATTTIRPLRKTVEIDEDLHEKAVAVLGIEKVIATNEPSYMTYSYFIRSWIYKESGSIIHEIYVAYSYSNSYDGVILRSYEAYNQEGQPLQLTKTDSTRSRECRMRIDSDGRCASFVWYYWDEISVVITDEYLKKHLNGFSITVSSSWGDSHIIELTPEQTILQLKKIIEYKKSHNL